MAGSSSGRGAYFLGAVFGLFISVAVVGALSVYAPNIAEPAKVRESVTPVAETTPVATPDPAPAAQPEPETNELSPQPVLTDQSGGVSDSTSEIALSTPTTPSVSAPEETDDAPAPAAVPEPDATPARALAPGEPATDALIQFGELFDGDPNEPILAIVLDGVGENGPPTDELFLLPAPLTVAIDSGVADPRSLVADARGSGFEAIAAIREFSGASPDAIAARAAVTLDRMGEVIGVSAPAGSLVDGAALDGLMTALAPRGMALVDASLDDTSSVFRTASRAELPAVAIGRRFDEVTSSAMVFQALERAAFDARRTGAYVVVGRADPSIITGLRRWINVKSGKSVKVAPLSEVVRRLKR